MTATRTPVKKRQRRMMSTRETSEFLHVHPNTVRRWSDSGLLPTCWIGPHHRRRFKIEDIQAFLQREDLSSIQQAADLVDIES